jgi:hypothetical protein
LLGARRQKLLENRSKIFPKKSALKPVTIGLCAQILTTFPP